MKITKENIKKAFVSHTEMIGDYVYNNQDWYEEDAERMRYILATLDMSPGDPYSEPSGYEEPGSDPYDPSGYEDPSAS